MWRVIHVECDDFISFKHAELDIPQDECTLIYGINEDNAAQRNNGTGKSSIIEAIAFAITGDPLRAVDKLEEIINDHSDSARVLLKLTNDYDGTAFTIERTIYRKNPTTIVCHKYDNSDVEIEQERTSQPTVLDYNRYILEEIGISKDDLYSHYILSKTHYKSFFDAPDKTKKAMINRFSGADLVDLSIEELHNDMAPVASRLEEAKGKKIAAESKIDVINSQLADADNKRAEWEENQAAKIGKLNDEIAEKNAKIRELKDNIKRADERLCKIDDVSDSVEKLEKSDMALNDVYSQIVQMFHDHNLQEIKNYSALSSQYAEDLKQATANINSLKNDLKELEIESSESDKKCQSIIDQCNQRRKSIEKEDAETQKKMDELSEKTHQADKDHLKLQLLINETERELDRCDRSLRQLKNQLHGAVECPKCKHKFFVDTDESYESIEKRIAKESEDYDAISNNLESYKKESSNNKQDLESIQQERNELNDKIRKHKEEINALMQEISESQQVSNSLLVRISAIKKKIASEQSDIEMASGKIESLFSRMIDEAFGILDAALDKGENYIDTQKSAIKATETEIETLCGLIEKVKNSTQDDFVASLKGSLKKYQSELDSCIEDYSSVEREYNQFVEQENHFVAFRSYLANKKVEAIAGVTNQFLEKIGSDMRVEMQGFKQLKNGSIRDKITVNLLRNGVPCGSYARHSGGEKARINLASILGLQRLTNFSAEKGKGLELLILDEILSESDTAGLSSINRALNDLKITSLLVTQDTVCDCDNIVVIVKEGGYSHIQTK